ncbi:MAG: hypothetical protein A2087_05330 [Spirochaetes bacterium GWD1_61_31]|nr:MAG: hypothetical protein A2Y37_10605 [Spirochaetes bacterium GWB1_60_80]OHD29772.1 MAG: hypothetical protein A2004_04880 [Spirochaetes bacterium GWC1_61_12]OHD42886.1 MAG: hypothetical protein A2Y35_13910 [Spirochaetes bacterium GWE1_60_18]OHD43463.1 MAG: hypothetical protein A2087_05330 [Spirochaetes bacterium GWD1_61_31]OHD59576.1 MAG: hypothetical protein A2Y32_12645 [Spirochaetes bacterium GWF1_60_12]HAP43750.1 hypothetical protein [Spirochaetaceae bacterium]
MKTINTQATVPELKQGWLVDPANGSRICLFCGRKFERGQIYPVGAQLFNSRAAVERHIIDQHGGAFAALMQDSGKAAGLSDIQATVLAGLARGADDASIAANLDNRALSTVRAHRRNLRLRYEEAKLFVAAMELAMTGAHHDHRFVDFGPELPIHDERSQVTSAEADQVVAKYFRPDGSLERIPPKEKQKLIILNRLQALFEPGREYSDAEVRAILGRVNEDHAMLRRYLVDYRFLSRNADGSKYWR